VERDTVTLIWFLSYIAWLILVFPLGQRQLWPMLYGLIFGTVVGGIVSIFLGWTWGFIAMAGFVAWIAWYIYGDNAKPPEPPSIQH
jgi:hypothetical protein